MKTLKEKEEEKRRREAEENIKLFGKVKDKSHHHHDKNFIGTKKERKQSARYATRSKGTKSLPRAANKTERKRSTQTSPCNARPDVSSGKHAAEERFMDRKNGMWKDAEYFREKVEDAESDDEVTNEDEDDLAEKSSSVSIGDADDSTSSSSSTEVKQHTDVCTTPGGKRRNSWTEDTETVQSKRLCNRGYDSEGCDGDCRKEHSADSGQPSMSMETKKKNRRTIRVPVKNLKPRKVSFMDCSYWQK